MPAFRTPILVSAVLAVGACGGDGGAASPPPPVRLLVEAPADATVVRGRTVDVRGTVRPAGADVRVAGEPADVRGSTWSAEVELEPGGNIIDVAASDGDRDPDVEAIRIVREVPVSVPDLKGLTPGDASERLASLGLEAVVDERGGLLDGLLPGELGVCDTDPPAGQAVRPGATVTVRVAKVC